MTGQTGAVNIGQIVVVSATATLLAVLQILLVCVAGYIIARLGYLDKKFQKSLNTLNLNLFTPALIFSKIALQLDASQLGSLALVPVAFVVFTGISTLGAWALALVLRLSPPRRKFVMGCAMAVNSNSLPIALIQSLSSSVKALKRDANDTPDAMLARGISYLIIYSTLGLVWRYSFMVGFLAKANEPEPERSDEDPEKNKKGLATARPSPSKDTRESPSPGTSEQAAASPAPPRKSLGKRILAGVWEITTPPLVSAIVSLIVAAIKPVQTVVAKATPLTTAINLVGGVSIPITLVVLGAYFVKPKSTQSPTVEETIVKDPTENRTVVASVVSRMILSPILLIPLFGAFILGTLVVIFDDPVFVLAMMLLITGPTAVTMAQLTSKSGAGPVFERMISSVIFWSYIVLLTPITILSALISIIISTTPDFDDLVRFQKSQMGKQG